MNPKGYAVATVSLIIMIIVFASTLDVVVDEIAGVNTTGWDFTGDSGAISLMDLIPFVYIASGLLMVVGLAINIKGGGD